MSIVLGVVAYETVLTVPASIAETFSFVSDFRNAARWDPRTYGVEMTTPEPIDVGSRFMLTGGIMREDVVERFHIPRWLAGMALPYDVVEFDPPNEFVLEGETKLVRYCDHLEFSANGDSTRLRYYAQLEMKGPLRLGEPMLRRIFELIGEDATRDIPAAVGGTGNTS